MSLAFTLLLTLKIATAAEPAKLPWVKVAGVPSLSLSEWGSQTGYRAYPDANSGRVLLEQKGKPPLILLLDAPYSLAGERFLALPDAPRREKENIYLSARSGGRLFLGFLEGPRRETLAAEISRVSPPPPAPSPPAAPPKAAVAAEKKRPAEADRERPSAAGLCERPVKRIFLDPGHGGDDNGTEHGHVSEKDVVLKFASLAASELRKLGFEVSYSRSRDVFLPLDIRTKLSAEWKADLFISLHVNSSPVSSVHGTETYILSPDATDAEARKLALLENSAAEGAKASSSAVQDILWDMEQTSYLQESAYLASHIQGAIVANAHDLLTSKKAGDWKNRGVRQAPFYVLSRAPMPAVLVELGYLSNARDRKLLSDKIFQESLAKALADGVKKYKDGCRAR